MPANAPAFDAVIGNPPYQESANSGSPIWQDFAMLGIEMLDDGGLIGMIHPPRWRGIGTTNPRLVGELGETLKALDIEWLSIHNLEDGRRDFNVGVRYDMYVARKSDTPGFKTEIRDEEGNVFRECVKGMEFIPNCDFGLARSLMAKEGEERVDFDFSKSIYFTATKTRMSEEKKGSFKYPCIHSIKKDKSLKLWWSNERLEFFGRPKVVFGIGHSSGIPHADHDGSFGMTEYAAGIFDKPENLDSIAKAMDGFRFRKLMQSVQFTTEKWNRNVIKAMRKDFWKEFVNENGDWIDADGNAIGRDGGSP